MAGGRTAEQRQTAQAIKNAREMALLPYRDSCRKPRRSGRGCMHLKAVLTCTLERTFL
ncbi:hypothetical protein ABT186_24735, partial [Streptomyces sp. NPDC001634]